VWFFETLGDGGQGRSHLPLHSLSRSSMDAFLRLDSSLESAQMSLRALEGRDQPTDHCAQRFCQLRDDLAMVVEGGEPDYVHWLERRARTRVLGASPIDISGRFRDGVLFAIPSVVLTSATLSTGGDFTFLRSRLGIDFDVEQISLPAPFDYASQTCLYVPTGLPDPREDGFLAAAAEEACRLIALTGGGALVLCTSVRNMRALHDILQAELACPVLLQGSSPKSLLLSRFLEDPSSVLVATTSFWQGVDLPGDALRLVVIDKLPFASPSDPIVAARIDHLREKGGSPFRDYQVPQAALALKQGFGRLIRTRRDTGLVAILDKRLGTMGYARTFFGSLPPCPRTDSFDEATRWWQRVRGARPENDAPSC
jgi:ATP-dependent DNA helicase DinG